MYPPAFEYHRAASTAEALDLLARHAGAKLLAGGHSLIPMMKLRLAQPAVVIDIGRLEELAGVCADGDLLRVGALTTHARLAADPTLREACPLLAEAAGKIGDPQVRNKGTIGGNIAHADPASDLPAVLVALGAAVRLQGADGERRVPADEFFHGLLQSDVRPGELITEIEVPRLAAGTGSCYLKVEHPASGYAVCGAAAVVTLAGGECTAAALGFNGVTAMPLLATAVAEALVGSAADDDAIDRAVTEHLEVGEPLGDLHASGPYRANLARVYGRRALKTARDRAG